MSQPSTTRLHVGRSVNVAKQLSELVMAWATDADTGMARYIHELGPDRAGAKCGCLCPACGSPLTAVNAAKDSFIKRPHFRHPNGAGTDQCAVLSARVALLQSLSTQGWIDLPARRLEGFATGLSGHLYKKCVSRKPERVHIRDVQYLDRVTALFTLADGRQIRVVLTGTVELLPNADLNPPTTACIYLDIEDDSLKDMSPEEIRSQLKLVGDRFCWNFHWDDIHMQEEANQLAKEEASLYIDAMPDGLVLPDDMPSDLKRETVLHYVVKQILEEAGEVCVPAHPIKVIQECKSGHVLVKEGLLPAQQLSLQNVVLEKYVGKLRPDLFCLASVGGIKIYNPLFIEVAVTHRVSTEKALALIDQEISTLELDISCLGGCVTRTQLKELVVHEVGYKRWVFNKLVEDMRSKFILELEQERVELDMEWEARQAEEAALNAIPVQEVAKKYLDAVREYLMIMTVAQKRSDYSEKSQALDIAVRERKATVKELAAILGKKGHPEAADETLYGWHGTLAKLLSIQCDRGVGYNVNSGFQVLNACFQANPQKREYAALCMAAAKIFNLPISEQQQQKISEWRREILESIDRGEKAYARKDRHDSILALLFPMLRDVIEKTRIEVIRARRRASAERNVNFSGLKSSASHEKFMDGSGHWLIGRDLVLWIKENPKSASMWGLLDKKN